MSFPQNPGFGQGLTDLFLLCRPLVQRHCQGLPFTCGWSRWVISPSPFPGLSLLYCRKAPSAVFEHVFVLTLHLTRSSTLRPP